MRKKRSKRRNKTTNEKLFAYEKGKGDLISSSLRPTLYISPVWKFSTLKMLIIADSDEELFIPEYFTESIHHFTLSHDTETDSVV